MSSSVPPPVETTTVICNAAAIPADELKRTYDWVKSWGMLDETQSPLNLVNMDVQNRAHAGGPVAAH